MSVLEFIVLLSVFCVCIKIFLIKFKTTMDIFSTINSNKKCTISRVVTYKEGRKQELGMRTKEKGERKEWREKEKEKKEGKKQGQ
jgi:hypothetical protein